MTTEPIEALVLVTGWDAPVQKIPLVRMLREHAGLSLTEATRMIDCSLRGEMVEIAMPDRASAEALAGLIAPLGLRARVQRSTSLRLRG